MRKIIFGSGIVFSAMLIAAELFSPAPLIIWNKTESVQKGLYLRGSGHFERGDIVAVMPPAHVRSFLTERNYLPNSVPILKRIAAMNGDQICRKEAGIFINQQRVAIALATDSLQRPMPIWGGCFTLKSDEFFLLNSHPKSLDGRYFGVTRGEHIIGQFSLIHGIGGDETSLKSSETDTEYKAPRRAR